MLSHRTLDTNILQLDRRHTLMVTDAATRVSVALDICQKETYRLLGCADVGQLTVYLDSNTAGEGTAAILLTYRDVGRRDGVA